MVISKRCKVCTVLDAENIPISGEYFGKSLPDLIVKISGIELDPRKANGVLICLSCAIQLVHTGSIVDKLRNTLQRLKKLEPKSKTPLKNSATPIKSANLKENLNVACVLENGKFTSPTKLDDTKLQFDKKAKSPKNVVSRKSEHADGEDKTKNNDEAKQINKTTNLNKSDKFENNFLSNTKDLKTSKQKSLLHDNRKSKNDGDIQNLNEEEANEISSQTISEATKVQNERKIKTPQKKARRKSVYHDENHISNDEAKKNGVGSNSDKSELDEIEHEIKNRKSLVSDSQKVEHDKNDKFIEDNTVIYDFESKLQSKPQSTQKFKKLMDPDVIPPVKKTPSKRKLTTSTRDCSNSSNNDTSPIKRIKTTSTSAKEESLMNCTIDEHDDSVYDNEANVMNCIICGKAFHQKGSLRDHIETSHMGERLKACPHCSSEFRSLQKYESHVFSEKCKNAKHACQFPKCNKRFKSLHKMELHMREKHSSQNEQEME